ncbi:hypothetical protein AYJ54_18585 [Bradyrhizobium centrolobii]|uniref:Uncharacterized protein n=1 Tax=Bradyrhizobium centrolobii TaxID=1505087 RepID=A0A176YJB9_9BRAD|nr:hypothetical protein [Bradyrhizobium centrolobii]OAF06947.1 hypothetical protein AYJ54_18585 [Bradyrhizobium centrolobii]
MTRVEDRSGIAQETLLLLLHPDVMAHLGAVAVQLPVIADRQMVGKDLVPYEKEPVFAKEAIRGTIVDVVDHIAILIRAFGKECGERRGVLDLLEEITAMRPGRPRQQREGKIEPRRKARASVDAYRARHAAAGNGGQIEGCPVPRRPHDLRRIIDDGLAQASHDGGSKGKHLRALIGVGDEVDDDVSLGRERRYIRRAPGKQRQTGTGCWPDMRSP